MSEEESFYQWFNRCFWKDYIGGLKSRSLPQVSPPSLNINSFDILREFQTLNERARSAGLYMSRNEELDDVTSSGLLLLVIPYVIGDIIYNEVPFDRDNRVKKLAEVQHHWEDFIEKVEQIDICIRTVDGDDRSRKVENHRRQEILRPVIPKLAHAMSGSRCDLDEFRADILDMIELFALKVQNDLRFVIEEMQLLKSKPSDGKDEPNRRNESQNPKKLWSMKLDKTLIRTIMQKDVFRPDISMPTISLEEFAHMELARIQDSNSKSVVSEQKISGDQFYKAQREEESQQEIKDRKWDDWKDENPRGMGNKLVNRG